MQKSSKHKLIKAIIIFIIMNIVAFISGITIFFKGVAIEGESEVDQLKVINSNWNSVEIDYTKYNYGDDKTITLKKPFFIKVNPGDMVDVKYPVNKPEEMHYVINHKVGLIIIGIQLSLLNISFILVIMIILTFGIKKLIERKKYEKK